VYLTLDGQIADWTMAQPSVRRALIVVHGLERNAEQNHRVGQRAIRNAGSAGQGTLLIGPQFLEEVDAQAHGLSGNVLRWTEDRWMAGANAENAHLSSYDAIDVILAKLADRKVFPNLKTVVLAGHSAGGQFVQRYAAVGKAGDALERSGIHLHFVVANPSSYLYFTPDRPALKSKGDFTFEIPSDTCHGKYNHWKYGLEDPPPYVGTITAADVEQRYVGREIVYLLGTSDNDPNHPELDKSCGAEDEGPQRFFRGQAFFRYLQMRHTELAGAAARQRLWAVPGVDHDNDRMFNSECGLAALFEVGTCTTPIIGPRP
jgi:pimeloyl-ACP methyl ester carboxylesterase